MGLIKSYAQINSKTGSVRHVTADEDSRGQAIVFASKSNKVLQMLTGEFDYKIFDTTGFVNAISKILSNNGQVDVGFHIDNDIEIAKKHIGEYNTEFIKMLRKHKNRDKCNFHWTKERCSVHFMVSDKENLYLEKEHNHGSPSEVWIKYGTDQAEEWHSKYQRIIKSSKTENFGIEVMLNCVTQ